MKLRVLGWAASIMTPVVLVTAGPTAVGGLAAAPSPGAMGPPGVIQCPLVCDVSNAPNGTHFAAAAGTVIIATVAGNPGLNSSWWVADPSLLHKEIVEAARARFLAFAQGTTAFGGQSGCCLASPPGLPAQWWLVTITSTCSSDSAVDNRIAPDRADPIPVAAGAVTFQTSLVLPSCAGPQTYVAAYLYPPPPNGPAIQLASTPGWSAQVPYTGLDPNTLYTFTFTAWDGANWTPWAGWTNWFQPVAPH